MENINEALASEIAAVEAPIYDGYPHWRILLTMSGCEEVAARWLRRAKVHVYLPQFVKRIRSCRGKRFPRTVAAIPGMLFVPEVILLSLPAELREHVLDLAKVHMLMKAERPVRPSKADIELIRIMETKLNLPQSAKGCISKVDQQVMFTDALFGANWLGGKVVEVVGEGRIGVEVSGLFGRTTKVYVTESEIEAK